MLASIWSIALWALGILVTLLVFLFIVMAGIEYASERRMLRDLRSNNPERRERAAKILRDRWRTKWNADRSRGYDWRARANSAQLSINALSSTKLKARIEALMDLGAIGFAESVPKLILLLDSQDRTTAFVAEEAIKAIAERFEIKGGYYWGICPRCESPQTTEGNYTGWVCQTCNLRYSPKGSRDPLQFVESRGFHGGPWDRTEFVRLLDAVNKLAADALLEGARGELLRDFSADAERILLERRQIFEKLPPR